LEKFIHYIQDRFQQLTDVQKRQLILVCTIIFASVLTFFVIVSISNSSKDDVTGGPEKLSINYPIPPGELFLPDEPDYIPGVLLDREQRASWTEQNALEFWQDPLRYGEEQWREKIEAVIDEFLERVP